MRKIKFTTDYFYHIYNRGVDKRKIFLEKSNYYRFIRGLVEFNDENYVFNLGKRFTRLPALSMSNAKSNSRKLLVDITCFCLMPNHFHLVLKQIAENGISKFMQKLSMGYARYFNEKNKRSGSLFEGRFKAIFIEKEEYFLHLSRYIHLNPLELRYADWKKRGISNWEEANKFLVQYRWSSYSDYIGRKNFSSIINRQALLNYFREPSEYKKFVNEWAVKDLESVSDLTLE